MKTIIQNLLGAMLLLAVSLQIHAQGTLVYDQQSANAPVSIRNPNVDGLNIQEDSPLLQSFVPMLDAIGFVQLDFVDIPNNGSSGATVYVNLWTGSPNVRSATFLGSTTPVYMPDGFGYSGQGIGITNFYFSVPISLTINQTYYLQPVVVFGDAPWDIITIGDTYPNGQVFENGLGFSTDFWFREGSTVPEPNALALIGSGSLLVFSIGRRSKPFAIMLAVLLLAFLILSAHANDSVVQATAEEARLAPICI